LQPLLVKSFFYLIPLSFNCLQQASSIICSIAMLKVTEKKSRS
jgi:hypothetical protein